MGMPKLSTGDGQTAQFWKSLARRLMTRNQIDVLRSWLGGTRVSSDPIAWDHEIVPLDASHLADARLYANRSDALEHLPKAGIIAEVGVAAGEFSEVLLNKLSPQRFDAFDIFRLHEASVATGLLTADMFGGLSHLEYYRRRFAPLVNAGGVRLIEGDSAEQLSLQPNSSYDIIYIDGDHSYEGALRDAEAAQMKLKPDGILIFNDYVMTDCFDNSRYGVVPVVNEFCTNRGWQVVYLALQRHMFCDIAIKRRSVSAVSRPPYVDQAIAGQ